MISDMMNRVTALSARLAAAYHTWRATEKGASMVEYVLIVSLIAIVAVFAVALVGQALDSEYSEIGDSVANYGR